MVVCELITAILAVVVLTLLWYLLKNRGTLEALGFPVLKPSFIFGSLPLMIQNYDFHLFMEETHKKLGKTWSMYYGTQPTVVTIDPDLIKAIMVKHFDHFTDVVDWKLSDDKITLDISGGEKWRTLRKALSPTFTSGKLKAMIALMDSSVDNLIKHIDKEAKTNPVMNAKEKFQYFTSDTIAACAFGIETNSFTDNKNDILVLGKDFISGFVCSNWKENLMFSIMNHFPFLNDIVGIYGEAYDKLFVITKRIIEERIDGKVERADFVGRLSELLKNPEPPLTPDLITAQGVVFLAAGLETTSNTMASFSFNLAMNPEIQDQIYEEILEVSEACGGLIDNETISQMHLLEAAISENLRMYAPATDQSRICTEDCDVNGIQFKKGTSIFFPTWPSHYNEEFFPEPKKFLPERFLKENQNSIKPFTYRPFGGGNRVCIGQRFAMVQMKLCMARLLQKFRLESCPETKLTFEKGSVSLLAFDEVKIKFVPRKL